MQIKNGEFEKLVAAIDFGKYPELESIVDAVVERYENSNRRMADWLKEKRATNPEYGHSKAEIEKMRKRKGVDK